MNDRFVHQPMNPLDLEKLERLVRDLRLLMTEGAPPREELDQAPLLIGWSRTFIPQRALIGRTRPAGPTVTSPLFAMADDEGWACTMDGWLRLAPSHSGTVIPFPGLTGGPERGPGRTNPSAPGPIRVRRRSTLRASERSANPCRIVPFIRPNASMAERRVPGLARDSQPPSASP